MEEYSKFAFPINVGKGFKISLASKFRLNYLLTKNG